MNPADAQIYPDAHVLHQDRYVAAVPPYHNMPDGIVKSPRLKEVCDSCSAAKVRCSSMFDHAIPSQSRVV